MLATDYEEEVLELLQKNVDISAFSVRGASAPALPLIVALFYATDEVAAPKDDSKATSSASSSSGYGTVKVVALDFFKVDEEHLKQFAPEIILLADTVLLALVFVL